MPPVTLMSPPPRKLTIELRPVLLIPPERTRVEPVAAPIPPSLFVLITPLTVAVPERTKSVPRPSRPAKKPPPAFVVAVLRLTGLGSVIPGDSSIWAPWVFVTAKGVVLEPRARGLAITTLPPDTLRPPVSTWALAEGAESVPPQPGLLVAASTSVPLSALITCVVAEAPLKGAESVSVLPAVVSITFVPPARRMSRAVAKVPVARRPALFESTIPLPAAPSAASLGTARRPAATVTVPAKSLAELPSTSVPLPAFVRPKAPVTGPERVRPWMTFEAVALLTVKVGAAEKVVVPVNSRP